MKYQELEDLFHLVSSAEPGEVLAIYCRKAEKVLVRAEIAGIDEIGDDEIDWDDCVEIPHKRQLDLGNSLVFEFAAARLAPEDNERVRKFFHKRGAYANLRELLVERGLLQDWRDFERDAQEISLRRWCAEERIPLKD